MGAGAIREHFTLFPWIIPLALKMIAHVIVEVRSMAVFPPTVTCNPKLRDDQREAGRATTDQSPTFLPLRP